MTTPSWLFLVLRFALYAGSLAAYLFGLVDEKGLAVAVGVASAASGLQAVKARPVKAAE